MDILKIDNGIFRLKVPFENLTTSVFYYVCQEGVAIIDAATYPSDVDNYILPGLDALGISRERVSFLLLTHHHGDHAGGLRHLASCLPDAAVGTSFETEIPNRVALMDGNPVFGDLQAVHLPGHCRNAFCFFEAATKTLLSGDCLQLDGVGKYRQGISDANQYLASIDKLRKMDIRRIVASHEYDPLGSIAEGKSAVARYLDACEKIARAKRM